MDYTIEQLNKVAQDVATVATLAKVGEIGIGVDNSRNQPANEMQDMFPALDWLMSTRMSQRMRADKNKGARFFKDKKTGQQMYLMDQTWSTNPPIDTTGECCWLPLDLTRCGDAFPLSLLCLKDCESIMDNLVNDVKKAQSIDLITPFQRKGESVTKARQRMARTSMAFFSAHNIMMGTLDTETPVLKPFHGLMQVMEDPGVFSVLGDNILSAFDTLDCRMALMGKGDFVFMLHPLTYRSLKEKVVPNRLGQLPAGWTRVGDNLKFNGYSFIEDSSFLVDPENGTGEIWMVDGKVTGVVMGTSLAVNDKRFIRESYSHGSREQGCATDCTFYYNFGGVGCVDTNRLAVITNVPLSNSCMGSTLTGLGGLIKPNTLVPR